MQTVDTILHPEWLLPISPRQVLQDHSLVIHQGKIHDLGPRDLIQSQYQSQQTHILNQHVLLPGFINMHTHSPMTLFRGLADDLPLMTWLKNHIWPAEQKVIQPASVRDGTRLAIAEMLKSGVTCFNESYFFTEDIAQVAIEVGMRAAVGCMVMNVPTAWADNEAGYLKKALNILENFPAHPLVKITLTPHAPYTVSDASFQQIKEASEHFDTLIHLHLHETLDEVTTAIQQQGKTPIQRLHDLQLLSSRLIAVHMVHVSLDDLKLIQSTNTHIVSCPESNLKLASGIPPLHQYWKHNIPFSLGTDGAASNNDLDLLSEMRLASFLAKVQSNDPTALNAMSVLESVTLQAARALKLDNEIGSIEIGKSADLITIDLSDCFTQPIYHPESAVLYAANRSQVSNVWVRGQQLLKQKELTCLDLEQTLAAVQNWQKTIQAFS